MDSTKPLDYALFQLTPTRTRFDLVLFYKGKTEKIASGLFDSFIAHLQFAKDEISRGGYSVSLRPPNQDAPWFTKATFERFVRFVSTPAVLERFVSLESEILQIEHSVQANELSNSHVSMSLEEGSKLAANGNTRKSNDSFKLEKNNDAVVEENSKIQLHRLLETRKALLRREQAMAYARGFVAGFELDNMDNLISFADAFGASRLRKACSDFKDLCKRKHGDGLWMKELAAVEACTASELALSETSGILLSNEITGPSQNITLNFAKSAANLPSDDSLDASKSDTTTSNASSDHKKDDNSALSDQAPLTNAKFQVPMPLMNQIPQFMYNPQGPIQQLPSYQGYPFTAMQPVPLHYPGNMQWPPGMKESNQNVLRHPDREKNHKSSLGKKKSLNKKELEYSGEKDLQSPVIPIQQVILTRERGGRCSESLRKSHESHKLKLSSKGKKSNNLTNGSDAADDYLVNASKEGKNNGNWDAFQNLLMRDDEEPCNGDERRNHMDVQADLFSDRSPEGGTFATSPIVSPESENFLRRERVSADSFLATRTDGENEAITPFDDFENEKNFHSVVKRRDDTDENLLFLKRVPESGTGSILSSSGAEASLIKVGREEDWFLTNQTGEPENHNATKEHTTLDADYILSSEGKCSSTEKNRKDILVDDSFMIQARPDDLYASQRKPDISMVADLTLASHLENDTSYIPKDKFAVTNSSEPNDLFMILERDPGFQTSKDSWSMDYGIDISLVETNSRSTGVESNIGDEKVTSNDQSTILKNNEDPMKRDPGRGTNPKVSNGSTVKTKSETIFKSRKPLVSRTIVQKSKLEKEEEIRKKMEELAIQRQKRIAERTAATSKKVPVESKTVKGTINCSKNKANSSSREISRISSARVKAP
ncbi:uncharacterized protein LOC110820941 [Carica papaya]|uniref:uncharacterized protein LOC110820941 n=1 Tax=Carica papaya TaxID=3649 RepID=UPI000B8D169F|nr:uncharacterized protein LOC110820941 [Carica papaya]